MLLPILDKTRKHASFLIQPCWRKFIKCRILFASYISPLYLFFYSSAEFSSWLGSEDPAPNPGAKRNDDEDGGDEMSSEPEPELIGTAKFGLAGQALVRGAAAAAKKLPPIIPECSCVQTNKKIDGNEINFERSFRSEMQKTMQHWAPSSVLA